MDMSVEMISEEISLKEGRVYFLGIGGSGMYGVARLAHAMGLSVTGSDAKENHNTARLRALGIPLCGEGEPLQADICVVVYSLAVSSEHPRLAEARERGLKIYHRAQFFGLLEGSFPIRAAVAGSHGKSSTTAMCAQILTVAGRSPTVVSGASLTLGGDSFREGEGDILLYEACEYRDAFLSLHPTHALVLNASWEHTDYFADRESVIHSFSSFLTGNSVSCGIAPQGEFPCGVTFGNCGKYTAESRVERKEGSEFLLAREGASVGKVTLSVPGGYQIENALGAAALCSSLGVSDADIVKGLCAYRGIPRRMEKRGTLRGVPLYLDFAHHPKELLYALKTAARFGRPLAVVFEPHTYSRTREFFDDYVRALRMPHIAGVLPIYAAREQNDGSVSSVLLAREAGVAFLADYMHAARFLTRAAGKGCTLLLIGAGGVEGVLAHLPFLCPAR